MAPSLLEWIYPSQPVTIEAPGSVGEAVRRLQGPVKRSIWRTPFRESLVGPVSPSRVVVRRYRPWLRNDFGPVFVGHFVQGPDAVRLEGEFTLHPLARWLMTLWFSFVGLFLTVGLVRIVARPTMGDELLFMTITLGMGLWGVGLLRFGRWMGRKDIPYIESGLAAALGGSVVGRAGSQSVAGSLRARMGGPRFQSPAA
jgi:hypothetical protein